MENASKALIMAAEILIGVMIISIGVYLFNTLGQYSAETTAEMESRQIAQFNAQFLKYYGTTTIEKDGRTIQEPIKCTIHDIVGLANLAKKNNTQNGFTEEIEPSDNDYYIQIKAKINGRLYEHLESKNQLELTELIKNSDIIENASGEPEIKYFICKEEPQIGRNTKLVNKMVFEEYNQ